jgi:hypothetical protein
MTEVIVWSLLTGSLGLQTLVTTQWLRQQQLLQAQQEEEEEVLTPYQSQDGPNPVDPSLQTEPVSPKDLRQVGWEFKILRAQRSLFRDPKILQQVCDEEAQAGWILLEKLDERRLRFKRPIAVRQKIKPGLLNYDPYRCSYGSQFSWSNALTFLALAGALILPAYLGYTLVSSTLNPTPAGSVKPSGPPLNFPPAQ